MSQTITYTVTITFDEDCEAAEQNPKVRASVQNFEGDSRRLGLVCGLITTAAKREHHSARASMAGIGDVRELARFDTGFGMALAAEITSEQRDTALREIGGGNT